jgi:signal transduction histidine kinase
MKTSKKTNKSKYLHLGKQSETEEALRLTRFQLEIILKNIADAVTAQDATGKLIFANDVAAKSTGYTSVEAMLAAPPLDYLNKFEITDEFGQAFPASKLPGRRAIAGEKNAQVLLRLVNRLTNETRWLNIKSTAIFDTSNNPYMVINTMQDLTERKRAEQEKSDFLSMASHELKTPLTSLTMFIGLLQKNSKLGNAKKSDFFIQKIKEQTYRLVELTNDLLDVSRIETGKLRLKKELFRLDELLLDVVSELQTVRKGHTIIIKSNSEIEIRADKYRLYQVMINLLTNAIKYSPGAKKIFISSTLQENEVTVSVKDFGIGIDKNQLDKVFDRLYQVPGKTEKTYPGLGLGLYITKEIIERHDGRIWVKSQKSKGSTFSFTIPIN